ncbi:transcriptional regulator, AraC family domain protein [Escherichia coli 2785200]|nr:transcriptional regulator, AraC family domain protein [Escherichia coli 2785200]
MPYICSIILVLNSFVVRIGKEDILFKKGNAVLIEYNLKVILPSNSGHAAK